jgi:hypothetical protein
MLKGRLMADFLQKLMAHPELISLGITRGSF